MNILNMNEAYSTKHITFQNIYSQNGIPPIHLPKHNLRKYFVILDISCRKVVVLMNRSKS